MDIVNSHFRKTKRDKGSDTGTEVQYMKVSKIPQPLLY